jgi:hypothetical protein
MCLYWIIENQSTNKKKIEAVHYERKTDLELECVWVELKIKFKKVLYGTFPSEQLGRGMA